MIASALEQVEQAQINTEAALLRVESAMMGIQAQAAERDEELLPMAWWELRTQQGSLGRVRDRLEHTTRLLQQEEKARA
jgi:hypothetical protein